MTTHAGAATGSRLAQSAADTLRRWTPPEAMQHELREAYLAHLVTHPDGWSRRCVGAHLTASSLICSARGHEVLLTLHARLGRWLQTGGHLEADDPSLEAAALREATEESGLVGLSLDPVPLLLSRHPVPCGPARQAYHLDVQFLVTAETPSQPVVASESLDVRWFSADALPDVDDSVRALVAAAGRRLGWSRRSVGAE